MRVLRAVLATSAVLALLVVASGADASGLSSSRAKRAVQTYVKSHYGSSYAVHPACYRVTSRRSRCFVHYVHNASTCTNWATVKLRRGRAAVSVRRPSC
jgi:hypothetical protein